ncbi:hypothetical protein, partial [Pseudomonas syringae]|uniref:hypothetical protein n=1 Tax=Pseudomonas syringae TaxID=317 RepID=UPI001CEF7BB8
LSFFLRAKKSPTSWGFSGLGVQASIHVQVPSKIDFLRLALHIGDEKHTCTVGLALCDTRLKEALRDILSGLFVQAF